VQCNIGLSTALRWRLRPAMAGRAKAIARRKASMPNSPANASRPRKRRVRRRRGDGTRIYRGPPLVREVEAIQVGEELRLLLAEDSERLQELLSESLKSAGYRLDIVASVAELTSSAASVNYDLIIVDLGLPDGDGLAAIRAMRSAGISAPIVIITARGSIEDRISGLDSGADDYLIKPFNHIELLARVRALLRRPTELHATVLRKGKTELDETNEEVRCAGQPVDLRRSERRLLAILMRRSGVVAKSAIEEGLTELRRELSNNAIEALISRVRKALSEADSGITIETVRGVGYRLREESET
jgi:DNA-binding response OmpR family regulator